jgi:hypothetical protein
MHVQTIGTRAQVWHGTARKTSGGLTKSDLMQNKAGRIVSRAKHNTAKKEMRLVKYGYGTKKGEFGFVKLGSHKRRGSKKHRSRKMRGGAGMGSLTPADLNSDYMIKDVVPQQFGPLERALAGGRRRNRSQRGGYYGNSFVPADAMGQGIDGQGNTNYNTAGSVGVQEAAGMAGGKRRRRKCKGSRMRGGTGSRGYAPADLGSVDVQMAAGRGN